MPENNFEWGLSHCEMSAREVTIGYYNTRQEKKNMQK